MKAKIWLAFKKLIGPADLSIPTKPPLALPPRLAAVFSHENVLGETVAWAAPCVSGRGRGIPANLFGALVATNEEPRRLIFVARRSRRSLARAIDLAGLNVTREPKFLAENLVISPETGKGPRYLFVFARPHAALVEQIVHDLNLRLSESELQEHVTADSASQVE